MFSADIGTTVRKSLTIQYVIKKRRRPTRQRRFFTSNTEGGLKSQNPTSPSVPLPTHQPKNRLALPKLSCHTSPHIVALATKNDQCMPHSVESDRFVICQLLGRKRCLRGHHVCLGSAGHSYWSSLAPFPCAN